jgi:hypothetical protein
MEGKAIESSTGCEASTSELKSKDPEKERLKEIMGRSLLITGVAAILRACSRAAVAGEHDLVIPWYMIVVVCCVGVKRSERKKIMRSCFVSVVSSSSIRLASRLAENCIPLRRYLY